MRSLRRSHVLALFLSCAAAACLDIAAFAAAASGDSLQLSHCAAHSGIERNPPAVASAASRAQERLRRIAESAEFDRILDECFPLARARSHDDAVRTRVSSVRAALKSRSFSPAVRTVPGNVLHGAMAAFAEAGPDGAPLVLVNRDWVEGRGTILHPAVTADSIERTILQEYGHAIDALINPGFDSPGDEGALFADLVFGDTPDPIRLADMRTRDDWNAIWIDGVQVMVQEAAIAVGRAWPGTKGIGEARSTGSAPVDGTSFRFDTYCTDGTTNCNFNQTAGGNAYAIGRFSYIPTGSSTRVFYDSKVNWRLDNTNTLLFADTQDGLATNSTSLGTGFFLLMTSSVNVTANTSYNGNSGNIGLALANFATTNTAGQNTSTISVTPSTVTADNVATATVTVTAKLADGSALTDAYVTLAGTPGTSTISPDTAVTNASGVATFTVRSTTAGQVNYVGTINKSGIETILTSTVTVTFVAGPPARLNVVAQPVSGNSGVALGTAFDVKVTDIYNNDVTTPNYVVTATILSGPGGTLSGTMTRTTSSGLVSFPSLTITGPGGNYVLHFSASGIAPDDSDPVAICNLTSYYIDTDRDGYGAGSAVALCSDPGDGYSLVAGDCNPSAADTYPGAFEIVGNSVDNDCNGGEICFDDSDNDGYRTMLSRVSADSDCNDSQEASSADPAGDCDDADAAVNPGVTETCNGVDDDCDGLIDDGFSLNTYYHDGDGDGYGDTYDSVTACVAPDNYVPTGGDCDDSNGAAYPGAIELCDGIDDDCDGIIDNGFTLQTYYLDVDGDGYGVAGTSVQACVAPDGYSANTGDCAPNDEYTYPGAPERCDGVVNDCNAPLGTPADDGLPVQDYYGDVDSDGYGNTLLGQACSEAVAEAQWGSVSTNDGDCNDANPAVNPAATEIAGDEVDQNCDGSELCYQDLDSDGYSTGLTALSADTDCDDAYEASSADPSGDCDDANPARNPGAAEVCNGIDDDCNTGIDDGLVFSNYYADGDDDGYGIAPSLGSYCSESQASSDNGGIDVSPNDDDCNDSNPTANPGATEVCDGYDNDCDGAIDEGFTDTDADTYADCVDPDDDNDGYPDGSDNCPLTANPGQANLDGDAYGDACDDDRDGDGYPNGSDNCPDNANPSQSDLDVDGYGDACETDTDGDGYPDSSDNCPLDANPSQSDLDGDGYGDACDDDRDGDGVPNNSDNCPDTANASQANLDGDSYGDACDDDRDGDGVPNGSDNCPDTANASQANFDGDAYGDACDDDDDNDGYSDGLDCAPLDASRNPGAAEICDGYDNNCANGIDDGLANVPYYVDADDDGYGAGAGSPACSEDAARTRYGPGNYSTSNTDCQDGNAAINPGAIEVCANVGVDNDCSQGGIGTDNTAVDMDTYFLDTDGDGYGSGAGVLACSRPTGYAANGGDCNDSAASINPGAAESCDGIDNDCDAYTDEGFPNFDGDGYADCVDGDIDGDGSPNAADCDDYAADVYPGALENCANLGVNNDCDAYNDAAEAVDSTNYYTDSDGDGYGTGSAFKACSDTPTTAPQAGDCNDAAASVNPGAAESCDGIDNDCDAYTDEGFPNFDGDAYADCVDGDIDGDGSPNAADCDDYAADTYPGAPETCATYGIDNNCDGDRYDAVGRDYYRDADGDGYGDPAQAVVACAQPVGYVSNSGDCNDAYSYAWTGRAEVCDGYDNNCTGGIDEGVQTRYYRDADGDGFTNGFDQYACSAPATPPGGGPWKTTNDGDCDDTYATVYPGAIENCANLGVNNDCDAYNDAAEAIDSTNYYTDSDGDGYGTGSAFKACSDTPTTAPQSGDCDDGAPGVNPGAAEVCDGINNDCDSYTDEGFPNFDGDGYADCVDGDTDNDGSPNAADCDDYATDIYPDAPELCATINIDNDCDGNSREATDLLAWARDVDGDGYGTQDPAQRIKACTAPAGYAPNIEDCNDADRYTYPDAPERCDTYGTDNDCDGDAYEGTDPATWYADADGDTYGNPASAVAACIRPSGYVGNGGDCNDSASYAWTGRAEICDGYDNNCTGGIDEGVTTTFYRDADGDGYGKASSGTAQRCSAGDGYVASSSDCDDTYGTGASAYPGATEQVGNGRDDSCDGYELCYWDRDNDSYLDGYGATVQSPNASCDDAYENSTNSPTGDCNDASAAVYPGAPELCSTINVDNDCDGNSSEAENAQRYYRDADGDGYGAGNATQVACSQPAGWVPSSTDCDDADRYAYPLALEIVANGTDNDCDGYESCFVDADNDKFLPASPVSADTSTDLDCDDAYEGGNSMPRTDGCPSVRALQSPATYWVDTDGDGYGTAAVQACDTDVPPGHALVGGDNCPSTANPDQANCDSDAYGNACDADDDNDGSADGDDCAPCDASRYPGAAELCATIGVDNDCDGNVDDAADFQPLYVDSDGDGYGDRSTSVVKGCAGPNMSSNSLDCNDANAAISPSASEVCDGSIDNDCDGYADDGDSSVTGRLTWYRDQDGDGYGDPSMTAVGCVAPTGYVGNSSDGCPTQVSLQAPATWYRDQDIDGYGDPAVTATGCTAPSGYVGNSLDQCPLNQGRLPGTWYRDLDGDGYGAADSYVSSCGQPTGYVANSADGCPDVYALQAPRTYYRDADGDGYGTAPAAQFCSTRAPAGYSAYGTDCNDATAKLTAPIRYYRDADGDGAGDPDTYTAECSLTPPAGYVSNSSDQCVSDQYKTSPGQCGCNNPDTDSDGDGYADCVDQSPWLYLSPASTTFTDGYVTVNVELGAARPTQLSTGAQMMLTFDTSKLAFVSASPASTATDPPTAGAFTQEVFESVNATAGTIAYGVGVADGAAGSAAARRVAVLRFRLAAGAICAESGLVRFAAGSSTYLSNQGGSSSIAVTTSDLGAITAYGSAAGFVGVPESWTRAADAGVSGSVFANPGVTFVQPCSSPGSASVTLSVTLASGGTSSSWPAGGIFPVGTSTVTWSAAGQSVTRTFTVLNHQLMDVTVSLAGAGILPSSRQIRMATGTSTQTVTATVGGSAAPTVIQIQVTVASGYACVQVKDTGHSLSAAPAVSVSGVRYSATASLDQGDSNGDNTVDILDFGMYVAAFGPAAPNATSNFDGDGFVNNVDFSFISFNFFKQGASCPGSGSLADGGIAGDEPRDRISVDELRKLGKGDLAIADLNDDGWVDTRDVGLWLQGVRP